MTGALNLRWADAFVAALAAAGLRRAVIAPGARSSPVALALLRRPEIRCEVITDERVAGYFALGLARAEGEPAAVLTTSGTAAGNLMPAVMEASLAGVPLLALTADRPPEALGWGANQTADQTQLYGSFVRAFHALPVPDESVPASYLQALAARIMAEAQGPRPGPVHVNLPFREPLLPAAFQPAPPLPEALASLALDSVPKEAEVAALATRLSGRRGVILCGGGVYPAGFQEALIRLAARLGVPILAELLSGLRFGSHIGSHIGPHVGPEARVFTRHSAFLRQTEKFPAEWILRLGAFPVSRSIERWLATQRDAEHILLVRGGERIDPLWQADSLCPSEPLPLVASLLKQELMTAPPDWLSSFETAERHAEAATRQACAGDTPFEGAIAATLARHLPAGSACFVGNSLSMRAMDSFSGASPRAVAFHGNRGVSGIDGNIATAAGIAAATDGPVAVLLGDQSALHDVGGVAAIRGRPMVIVVVNNNGGGIFDHLPLAAPGADWFETAWVAPQPMNFAGIALAHGIPYHRTASLAGFNALLEQAFAAGAPCLIEVSVDRTESRRRFAQFFAAAGDVQNQIETPRRRGAEKSDV